MASAACRVLLDSRFLTWRRLRRYQAQIFPNWSAARGQRLYRVRAQGHLYEARVAQEHVAVVQIRLRHVQHLVPQQQLRAHGEV